VFFYSDEGDEPVGVEFFGPHRQLENEGTITIVLPSGERVRTPDAEQLVRETLAADAA
jgi:hypothetical protein